MEWRRKNYWWSGCEIIIDNDGIAMMMGINDDVINDDDIAMVDTWNNDDMEW